MGYLFRSKNIILCTLIAKLELLDITVKMSTMSDIYKDLNTQMEKIGM